MKNIRHILLLLLLLCSLFVQAQNSATVEMADTMRSNGKIYVVVGVLVIILFGLLVYLAGIDRKISRIEKNIEENKKK